MKQNKEFLRKQKSGKLKNELLKQVMGNTRGKLQSEYSGQYNLSSSLYFQIMDNVLRGKNDDLGKHDEENYIGQSMRVNEDDESGMMKIYRGLDQIPGKTFTQSQYYFRHNRVKRDN